MLQYVAVAIQNDSWNCYKRDDYERNMENIANCVRTAVRYAELDSPVRLVALPEGGMGGWAYWAGGKEHIDAYNRLAPEIPGKETDFLGQLCKEGNFYLIGQMQAKDPEIMENRIFNIAFIIDPNGKIIHKHHKTGFFTLEPMTAPTDIWERFIELYGDDPVELFNAVFPVARTEIGNIGTLICAEGSFPEAARGVALNGAEIIWRANYVEPWKGNNIFEMQNRSHAVFNACYILAPDISNLYGAGGFTGKDETRCSYGNSFMVDYRGNIISRVYGADQSHVSGVIDIDGLREFRTKALWSNWTKDMRIEQYKVIYDAMMAKGGMYTRNLCMDGPPLTTADQKELARYHINKAVELGIYMPPPEWKPYKIRKEVLDRVEKAKKRK
jgi:predicted amidohydrolase